MSKTSRILRELRHRRMFRTAALYVVLAWVLVQLAEMALGSRGIPDDAIRFVWIGVFLGFPLAMLFAWRYQVTPKGIVLTKPGDADKETDISLSQGDYVLLAALALIIILITLGVVSEIRGTARTDSAATAVPPMMEEPRFQALFPVPDASVKVPGFQ